MTDYWLNAPTFAPLEPAVSLPRRRNQRLSDLLGAPVPQPTFESRLAQMRANMDDEKTSHSADENAIGSLGFIPESD